MARERIRPGKHGKITTTPVYNSAGKIVRHIAKTYFRDTDGELRLVTASGRSQPKAKAALDDKISSRVAPSNAAVSSETLIVALADRWRTRIERSNLSANTKRRYGEILDLHIVPELGKLTIGECTSAVLEGFLDDLGERIGKPTAKLAKTCLSGMWTIASRYGAAPGNIVKLLAPIPVDDKPVVAWSTTEVLRIRAAVRHDEQAVRTGIADLLDTLLGTGSRIGEALALKWKHLDLDGPKPSVLIEGTVVRLRGGGMFIQPHPKGGPNGKRRLFLHNWTVQRLAARRALVPHDPEDLVFPSARGTLRDPRNARKQLKRILTRLGFTEIPQNPHTARKTVGTQLAEDADGGQSDISIAAAQLGNTEAITRRHYVQRTHVGPDARERFDAFALPDENEE
ncbi:tyrosine-type recombinase/integrase [Nocardia anaemiae]|uniref:tyrosine-type recombinase/integrase n=1 Tax=Nocardia anaemiae TaxID=263910 RepID=UPI000A4B8F8D|nr:site-specific integrase [Nocardia anaemiae]